MVFSSRLRSHFGHFGSRSGFCIQKFCIQKDSYFCSVKIITRM